MRLFGRWWRLLLIIVAGAFAILLGGFFLVAATDRFASGPTLLHSGRQNECPQTGIEPDLRKDITGDPDLTERPNPGAVKIIRLNNEGKFVDRCQLTDALYELNWEIPKSYGPRKKADARDLPRLSILYVHGWKHGPSLEDEDRKAFTKLVEQLQATYAGRKQVVGIYVSWSASTGFDALNHLSFWSKKTVADRIAQSGAVTRIVTTIGALRKANDQRLDQFIAIGHSFGARILFAATSHPLVGEAARAHPGTPTGEYQVLVGSADSVILLNPAFEASMYTTLDSFCRKEAFQRGQAPLLIAISTENDWATGQAFPLGQRLGLYSKPEVITTLGNFTRYKSHSLYKASPEDCLEDGSAPGTTFLTEAFAANGMCLKRDPAADDDAKNMKVRCPNNPFLVAGTSREIIDGHNGIWTDHFREWVFALITALEENRRTLLARATTSSPPFSREIGASGP